jgi:hypothetical protein
LKVLKDLNMNNKPATAATKAARRSKISLAAVLRDKFKPELVADWYLMLLSGKKPIIVEDKRYDGGMTVIEAPGGYTPPTLDQMMTAMARIIERRDGMPAQHMHLEAAITAEVTALSGGMPSAGELPPGVADAIRNALKASAPQKYLPSPEPEFPELDVQDAEIVGEEPQKP